MSVASSQRLRRMTLADLELVRTWRNHPDIRRYMCSPKTIAPEEHAQWFDKASQDPDRHLLIFEQTQVPLGFVNIHQIAPGGIADWGLYAAPDTPRGVGRSMGEAALRYVFLELGLHKLTGQVLGYNERSIRFHRNLGFQQEGTLRQQHFDGEFYHDVVCFGLLAGEWPTKS